MKGIITIDYLRKILVLEDKHKTVKDLRWCVLEPAIQEINKFSDIYVELGRVETIN